MLRSLILTVIIVGSVGSPLVASAQEQDQSKRLAAIGVLNEAYVTAFNAGDAVKLKDYFSETAEFTLLTGQTVSGRDQVGEAHADFFQNYPDAKISGEQLSIRSITPHVFLASGTWKVDKGPTKYPDNGVWFTVVSFYTGKLQYEAMRLMGPPTK